MLSPVLALFLAAAPSPSPELAVPPGWRAERIDFPLGFAPSLPYRGHEDLRFMPGMFKPAEPDYFSYAFLWWVEGAPALDAAALERDLKVYFQGLMGAVGKDKGVTVKDDATRVSVRSAGGSRFTASVQTVDAFNGGAPLDLALEIDVQRVGGHTAGWFVVTPAKAGPEVKSALRALVSAVRPVTK